MDKQLNIRDILGATPSSDNLLQCIRFLTKQGGLNMDVPLTPDVIPYKDVLYMNYRELGLSLLFTPRVGTTIPQDSPLEGDKIELDSIDIYNVIMIVEQTDSQNKSAKSSASQYAPYSLSTICLPLTSRPSKEGPPTCLELRRETTGKEILQHLGEPERKGGGTGPSSGSIDIWCEWSKDGIMIEFGGAGARGPQAWEKGKDAMWKVLTVFRPKAS